jgi:hypothetical protein
MPCELGPESSSMFRARPIVWHLLPQALLDALLGSHAAHLHYDTVLWGSGAVRRGFHAVVVRVNLLAPTVLQPLAARLRRFERFRPYAYTEISQSWGCGHPRNPCEAHPGPGWIPCCSHELALESVLAPHAIRVCQAVWLLTPGPSSALFRGQGSHVPEHRTESAAAPPSCDE